MDIFKIATEDKERNKRQNERNWFNVDPATMYPAMIEFVQAQLAEGKQGDGIIRSQYYPAAQALPAEAWALALMPRDEVTRKADIEARANALEIARLWFTELLHRALRWQAAGMADGKFWHTEPPAEAAVPLGLRIVKDERWRL